MTQPQSQTASTIEGESKQGKNSSVLLTLLGHSGKKESKKLMLARKYNLPSERSSMALASMSPLCLTFNTRRQTKGEDKIFGTGNRGEKRRSRGELCAIHGFEFRKKFLKGGEGEGGGGHWRPAGRDGIAGEGGEAQEGSRLDVGEKMNLGGTYFAVGVDVAREKTRWQRWRCQRTRGFTKKKVHDGEGGVVWEMGRAERRKQISSQHIQRGGGGSWEIFRSVGGGGGTGGG